MPTLWSGRFSDEPAEALKRLSDSLPFDQRLFREDITGSRAHVRMLNGVNLIEDDDRDAILEALDVVEEELSNGTFEFAPTDEDIHTAVERRVTEITTAGAKMAMGRSRNDQVATDLRLWIRSAINEIIEAVVELQHTLLDRAEKAGRARLPGYTHLQRAQPILLAHHLLAHGWALSRDVARLHDARDRLNTSPLGAGAIAGTSLPIDPAQTAFHLDFDDVFDNSLDAVSDRDFVAETLFGLALLGVHLSRLGEDLALWASDEFGFMSIDDRFATGSSMMPQKRNPDIAELARGKSGRLIGNLTGLLATLKGLPLGYSKDLQEDKEPLFDSVDTVINTLTALDGMIGSAHLNTKRMEEAASSPYMAATALAEWLVEQGKPFREAHETVGDLVRRAMDGEGNFAALIAEAPDFDEEAAALFDPESTTGERNSHGGGSPRAVAAQIVRYRTMLKNQTERMR